MILHGNEASAATLRGICEPLIRYLSKCEDAGWLNRAHGWNRLAKAKHAVFDLLPNRPQGVLGVASPLHVFAKVLVEAEAIQPAGDLHVHVPGMGAFSPS